MKKTLPRQPFILAFFALMGIIAFPVNGTWADDSGRPLDRDSVISLIQSSYKSALFSPLISVEIRWAASFRDDFGRLGTMPPPANGTETGSEAIREKGISWIQMNGNWRRNYSSTTKMLGPDDLKVHVTIAGGDFVLDSRTKHADIVSLQYQTDDRIGKRGLSPTSAMSPGFVARVLLSELTPDSSYRFERKNGLLCVRSSAPEDLDVDIDEQSGTIRRIVTNMSPQVRLRANYSGSLGTSLYPAPQPVEMMLELESRTENETVTCSRFKFESASFTQLPSERFHWSDVAPLAHWQDSDAVLKKDGSIDEVASAKLANHNAAVAKPSRPQFEYSTSGPPALIDHAFPWRGWLLAAGVSLIAFAGVVFFKRR